MSLALGFDGQFTVLDADAKLRTRQDIAGDDAAGNERLDRVLDIAAQRPGTVLRVVGGVDDKLLCLRR